MILGIKKAGRSYFLAPKSQFLSGGLIACFVVICFLSLLSLRYPPEVAGWMPDKKWTYVAEARYFNLVLILFPLVLLIEFQDLFKIMWIKFTIMGTAGAFFIFSVGVSLYYIYKYSGNTFKENASIYYHYHQDIEDYLKERQSFAREESLLFGPAEESDGIGLYASLLQIPLFKITAIEGEIKALSPVCILLNINEKQSPEIKEKLQSFIHKHQLQPVREFPELQLKLYELCLP